MKRARAPLPAPVLVVGSIASIQLGLAATDSCFDRFGVIGATALRLAFAAAIMLAIVRPSLRRTRGDLGVAALYGLVLAFVAISCSLSIARVPMGVAISIALLGPLATALAGSRRRTEVAWVAAAAAGVVLLADPFAAGGAISGTGLAFAGAQAVGWAGYIHLTARTGARFRGSEGLALGFPFAAVACAAAAVPDEPGRVLVADAVPIGIGLALLGAVIPFSLEMRALRRMAIPTFGLLMCLEPVGAAIAGFLALDERLAAAQLAGMALIVTACAGATRSPGRRTSADALTAAVATADLGTAGEGPRR